MKSLIANAGMKLMNRPGSGRFNPAKTLAATLRSWIEPMVGMWQFSKSNGITEGFHTKIGSSQEKRIGSAISRITASASWRVAVEPDRLPHRSLSLMNGAYRNRRKHVGFDRLFEPQAGEKDRSHQLSLFTGTDTDDFLVVNACSQVPCNEPYEESGSSSYVESCP